MAHFQIERTLYNPIAICTSLIQSRYTREAHLNEFISNVWKTNCYIHYRRIKIYIYVFENFILKIWRWLSNTTCTAILVLVTPSIQQPPTPEAIYFKCMKRYLLHTSQKYLKYWFSKMSCYKKFQALTNTIVTTILVRESLV